MGLVETLRGQGTFVKNDSGAMKRIREEMAGQAVENFIAEMNALGLEK